MTDREDNTPIKPSVWDEPKLDPKLAAEFGEPPLRRINRRWVIGISSVLLVFGLGSAVYTLTTRTPRARAERELAPPKVYGNQTGRVPDAIANLDIATTPAAAVDAGVPDDVADLKPQVKDYGDEQAEKYLGEDRYSGDQEDLPPSQRQHYAASSYQPSHAPSGSHEPASDELPPIFGPEPKESQGSGSQGMPSSPSMPLGLSPTMPAVAPGGSQVAQLAAALGEDDDGRKERFMASAGLGPDIDNATDIGECEVAAGTPVHVSVLNALNTDLPAQGVITAQVTKAVYCGSERQHIAIPQGSTFTVSADPRVTYGQERILMCVERLRLPPSKAHPRGQKVDTGCATVADITGQVGLPADVDNHWMQLINGALLSTLLSLGTQATAGNQEGFAPTIAQGAARQAGNNINQVGQRIVQRDLQRKPTLRLDALEGGVVLFRQDVQLEPWRPRRR